MDSTALCFAIAIPSMDTEYAKEVRRFSGELLKVYASPLKTQVKDGMNGQKAGLLESQCVSVVGPYHCYEIPSSAPMLEGSTVYEKMKALAAQVVQKTTQRYPDALVCVAVCKGIAGNNPTCSVHMGCSEKRQEELFPKERWTVGVDQGRWAVQLLLSALKVASVDLLSESFPQAKQERLEASLSSSASGRRNRL